MRKDFSVRKRKGQYYIMTWHGGIGPKKIEREAENQLDKFYIKKAKHDSQMVDLMIAESDFTYRKYRTMLWYNGEILKCGTPARCFDTMFISDDGDTIKGIYPREKLFKGQTPETMRYNIALESYQYAKVNGLKIDSPSSLLLQLNKPVGLSQGSQENIKITTQEDIILLKYMLDRMEKNDESIKFTCDK